MANFPPMLNFSSSLAFSVKFAGVDWRLMLVQA
jgi:hypothetical protein